MASNVHAPSLSPPSENDSTDNGSIKFITLFGTQIGINGFSEGHLSFANINSNNKISQLTPPSSLPPLPPPPSSPSLPLSLSTLSSSSPSFPPPQSTPTSFNSGKRTYDELDVPPYKQHKQMQPQPTLVALDKKPRGRPIGSRNKPKPMTKLLNPTTPILRERDEFPKHIVLIVPSGRDIVKAITDFGREQNVNILVHHASGSISEVILSNPLSPSHDLAFQGKLHMFYLSGFYTNNLSTSSPQNIPYSSFTIKFSRGWSPQLFGGLVGPKLVAAEPVRVIASLTKKHEYIEAKHPITNPNFVQPVIKTHANRYAPIVNNSLNGISNNIFHHSGFFSGASSSFPMNLQPPTAPFGLVDVCMNYWNNPTQQGDNY